MANTILTPDVIAREALMILRNNAVFANLVYRDYSDEFSGKVGDTITVRKPASFTAKEFTDEIELQNVTETGVAVKLDKHLDVSLEVTTKELSLDIEDFGAQILTPAMNAFADAIDKYIIECGDGAATTVTPTDDAKDDLISARKALTDAAAPMTDRAYVCGSQVEADLLKTDLFVNASAVGDDGTALREASLGRKFGFDVVCDQNVDESTAYAFHKNAMALVTRTPEKPLGNGQSEVVNYDGFGLRVVYSYDATKKTDIISIDLLCGVAMLDDTLIAKVAGGASPDSIPAPTSTTKGTKATPVEG